MKIEAVDLFCGVGGLTSGLRSAGVKVVAGIDVDGPCSYPFEQNHPGAKFLLKDVGSLTGGDLVKLWKTRTQGVRLLAGCAPCQPFSSYTRTTTKTHDKWGLLNHFARLVEEAKPELVTMENVPGLEREEPFAVFLAALKKEKYHVDFRVVNGADYGVPQQRRRLVLVASRLGPIALPEPTHPGPDKWVTVRQAIGRLAPIAAGEGASNDVLHRSARLSELNLKRIRASKAGGTWRDWPLELVAECHRKESGKHSAGVYGRMRWDQPAPTMTTLCYGFGNGRFGHPEQDRAISLREAAIFQSFPEDYRFVAEDEDIPLKRVSRWIGNAVPPKLGEAVGKVFISHVAAHYPRRARKIAHPSTAS